MGTIEFIKENWDKFIWMILFLISDFYLYYYGIIDNWQKERAKKGIIRLEEINVPFNFRVNNKLINIKNCIKLFLLSTAITFIIFLIYISTTSVKFNSIPAFTTTSIALFVIVSAFVESPIDDEEFKKEKKYEYIFIIFGRIKSRLLSRIVDCEYYSIRKKNKKYLMKWINEKDVKIVALVNKLNKDLFMKKLPGNITEETLQELKNSLLPIAESYIKEDGELYDRLEMLFDEDLIKIGMRICDINEYLIKHKTLCSTLDKSKLEKELKKLLQTNSSNGKGRKPKQGNLSVLKKLITDIMESDNIDNSSAQ